jgi:DNA-binding response OmpR family regulator
MDKTILIVEDEFRIRDLITDYLKKDGYKVLQASNGIEALEIFDENQVDLILLDVMMPGLDGLSVCKSIRERHSNVLIIMLTARSEEYDKLLGYEFGADDYVTKPFSPKVLCAKINVLLKRLEITEHNNPAENNKENIFEIDELIINEVSHSVELYGEQVELTPKEFDLLLYLFKNQNMVLSRDVILNSIWGYDYFGDLRTVDTHIKRLRQKLKDKADIIYTIRGSGYKLEVRK